MSEEEDTTTTTTTPTTSEQTPDKARQGTMEEETATTNKETNYYSYHRMAHDEIEQDDLYDPFLDDDDYDYYYAENNDEDDDYYIPPAGSSKNTKGTPTQESTKNNKGSSIQELPSYWLHRGVVVPGSSASLRRPRYPKTKQKHFNHHLTKTSNNNNDDQDKPKKSNKQPPLYDERVEILWNEIWLLHRDWVYACRNNSKQHHYCPSSNLRSFELREVTRSQLQNVLKVPFGSSSSSKNNNNIVCLKHSKEFGNVSLEWTAARMPSWSNYKMFNKEINDCRDDFFVDSCRRTPELDKKIRDCIKSEHDLRQRQHKNFEWKREYRKVDADAEPPQYPEIENGRTTILDILAWHGIRVRLEDTVVEAVSNVEKAEAGKEPAKNENRSSSSRGRCEDGEKNEKELTTMGQQQSLYLSSEEGGKSKKALLRRLRLLTNGAFEFERTLWIQSPFYIVLGSGGHHTTRKEVPSEFRLLALDEHHCYFFQFCPSSSKQAIESCCYDQRYESYDVLYI